MVNHARQKYLNFFGLSEIHVLLILKKIQLIYLMPIIVNYVFMMSTKKYICTH